SVHGRPSPTRAPTAPSRTTSATTSATWACSPWRSRRRPPHLRAPPPGSAVPDRGLVREGYRADLVLFDPETVASGATFDAPRTLPTGIPYVLVDGRLTVEDGRRTQVLAGRSVRRTPYRGR
ncbi:hypothetical protein GA0115236_16241, partial [Streptomyces sp. IgraMP-1]